MSCVNSGNNAPDTQQIRQQRDTKEDLILSTNLSFRILFKFHSIKLNVRKIPFRRNSCFKINEIYITKIVYLNVNQLRYQIEARYLELVWITRAIWIRKTNVSTS